MKIAFYLGRKSENPAAKPFDWLVCAYTKSPYSHCELVIDGLCYSSSKRDGGVRAKQIDLNSGHWHVFDVDGSDLHALEWFKQHEGEKYDVAGLFGFLLPWRTEDAGRWFCSESCAAAMSIPLPWQYSPDDLYEHLIQEAA